MDDRTPTPAALLEGTTRALDHRLAVEQSRGRAPSMTGAVVRGGATVWTGGRGRVGDGPPTPDTQYRIGSITKTFVAVLVLRLRDEGRLGLDDALGDHLPDAPVTDPTIAHLVRSEIAMMQTPDGHGRLELQRYDHPAAGGGDRDAPSNTFGIRNVAFEVDDIDTMVSELHGRGFGLVGHFENYADVYKLCYARGPEGMIVMLAERIG